MGESLLYGPVDYIPPGVFDLMEERMIFDAATATKGSAGPSGMDAELSSAPRISRLRPRF